MEEDAAADDDRSERDKRKIGVVKLGVTNGILNFVFGVSYTILLKMKKDSVYLFN